MSVSARVPSFYRYAFTWWDPIVTAWSAWMYFTDPQMIVNACIPDTPRNPDLDMLFQQTGGFILGLCFIEAVLLRATDDLRTWKLVQYATLIIDASILYSLYWGLNRQGRLSVASWRGEDWGGFLITIVATLYRLAFVSELGFRASSKAKKNA